MQMRPRRAGALAGLVAIVTSLLTIDPAAAATTVAASMSDFSFQPQTVNIEPGDTVTWTNNDPEPHTATADDGSFSVLVNPGETKSKTFASAGSIAYYCKFHGGPGGEGMAGTVQVGATETPDTVNLGGSDNVSRAIEWSNTNFPDGSGFAVIGRDDVFADSLSSGAVQGKLGGPLLLTAPGALDQRTRAELGRLKAKSVYLLGGTGALSPAVEQSLKDAGLSVKRVAGTDRMGTATATADAFFPEATSALVVRALGPGTAAFVDALGAGAVAAAQGRPILFTETGVLSGPTKSYLSSHPITQVTIIGGEAAISEQTGKDIEALGIEVERIAGVDRFLTAAAVSDQNGEGAESLAFVNGFDPNAWADGFAASASKAPILLVADDAIPGTTAQHVADIDPSMTLICGATVSDAACGRLDAIRTIESFDFPSYGAVLDSSERPGDANVHAVSGVYKLAADPGALCYDYFGAPIEATAAHIHRQVDGSPAIPMPFGSDGEGGFFGCAFGIDQALLADVLANPEDYYLNWHTAEFPSGATSGTFTRVHQVGLALLSGEAEVPGPGDPDGAGFGFAFTTDHAVGKLCGGVGVFGELSSEPTAAHIHKGAPDASGPVVVTLATPAGETPDVRCYDISDGDLTAIQSDPTDFYVNVHTADFPDGAIRGQFFELT